MKTTDGRDKDILDKEGVETDTKYREETLKDTSISVSYTHLTLPTKRIV